MVKLLDIGDFISVTGPLMRTRMGELSVRAKRIQFLAKAFLPLPEKWHGLQDKETRYRRRYLDLVSNPEVIKTFQTRSRILVHAPAAGCEQVLDVMSGLMGDDIGRGEFAGAARTAVKAGFDLAEEPGIEKDLPFRRAVERTHRRLRHAAAAAIGGVSEQHDLRARMGISPAWKTSVQRSSISPRMPEIMSPISSVGTPLRAELGPRSL